MENKKNRIIMLSVILLAIIITGVFITIRNNKDSSTNKLDNKDDEKDVESDAFYYVEEFIGEEIWDEGYDKFLKYDDKIVKFKGGEKVYLQDVKSKEDIYQIPNRDNMLGANGYWIYENVFWNVEYDSKNEAVIASSFDDKGNKKDSIKLKDFKGDVIDNSYIQVEEMRVTEDYIYLLARADSQPILQIFTKTGELKNSYENVTSFDVDNKGRCIYTTVGSQSLPEGFFMVDSETGDEIFRNTSYILEPIRFSEDGNLIYGFDKELNVFDANSGTFIKSIFEFGKDSTYFLDDYDIQDFVVGKDEEIYYSLKTKFGEDQNIELSDIKNVYYLYTKKEGERPPRETVLTITAPYRNDFMEEAIKHYELKYPGEHVEYDYAYNNREEFYENGKEYGAKLALDIISGDIGDIVQTGGSALELQNLLRTDVFMDLTDLIEKDKNYKDLNKDVLNSVKVNNTIRALPVNYLLSQYELNEELEKELGLYIDFNQLSWSEVLDLVKVIEEKAPDRHLFTRNMKGKTPWETFGDDLLIANMPDLINLETKEVDLNQKWFKDLLIKFKECIQSKNFILDTEYQLTDSLQGSLLSFKSSSGERYYSDQVFDFIEYNNTHKSEMIPIFTGEKNDNRVQYSLRMYSINNRSDRKENAWKFLSFLLEEDIQFIALKDPENRGAIPINEKGVDRMIEDANYMHKFLGVDVDRYNKAMIEHSHEIDYLYNMGYLRLDILEPIGSYMDGKMTLDEALKKAEENVIIRLNE